MVGRGVGVMSNVDDMSGAPLDDEDVRVLEMLAGLLAEHDPVPPGLADKVSFALTVAALEAEVAELTMVSSEMAGVRRDVETADTVTFSGADLTAMITIETTPGGGRLLSGWVSSTPVEVELRTPTDARTTRTDDNGRFELELDEPCLVYLVFQRMDAPESRPMATPPIEI